ncbi:MAG TPA: large conductance mechanosensitive channel protein MscL [Anaerolineaceae bacterium]|nr:large conductance mechanosensitive channel protein MscL [Anaerolineaceae bacterium]HPS33037.1 large conductance mechanosensitive channel protein MscL [Anaerolineaceae bacterium]
MKKLLEEFKDFIIKGNALDLAIGVIIGGAYGSVINGIVNNLLMPPLGLLLADVDFTDLYIQLNRKAVELAPHTTLAAAKEQGAVVLAYGSFITTLLNFIIIAFSIFLLVKGIQKLRNGTSKLKKNEAPEAAEPTEKLCPFCQTKIPVKAVRCPHCTSELAE